jgi:hypothetical protein
MNSWVIYLMPAGGSSWRILPCDEIIARASFGGKLHDDILDFGAFESQGREFKLVGGF